MDIEMENISQLLLHWGLSNEIVTKLKENVWDIGERYVLKSSSNRNWLQNNITMIDALTNRNIPVADLLPTTDGSKLFITENNCYCISKKLTGVHITDIYTNNDKELPYRLGQVIGRLHIAFQNCEAEIPCYDNNLMEEMTGWISQAFVSKKNDFVPDTLVMDCIEQFGEVYPTLPRQLIHRDLHLGNMLFTGNELTGYIDFDLSQKNARIFDLCYFSLSLLLDHMEDDKEIVRWLHLLHNIVNGYRSKVGLTKEEEQSIPIMMAAIELLFTAYFTNQNQQEAADSSAKMLLWIWENKEEIMKYCKITEVNK